MLVRLLMYVISAAKKSSIEDVTQNDLREVQSTGTLKQGEKILADLRKRKLIVQKSGFASWSLLAILIFVFVYRKGQWFTVYKGDNFSTSTAKPETDLTVDMLTS